MLVGVPKEIKDSEYRVGLVPSTVRELTAKGHQVIVEQNAGLGAGLGNADYHRVLTVRDGKRGGTQEAAARTDAFHLPASGG